MEQVNKEEKFEEKKVKITKERKKSSKDDIISFDAYFRLLMTKDSSILPHHKAPMRAFLEQKGKKEGTSEEFSKILSKY